MERLTPKARLLNDIEFAKDSGRVLDVSNMSPNTRGIRFITYSNDHIGNKFIINNIPIVSNNYESYKLSINILGKEYQYLSDYYLIILEIKKGDKEYIKKIAEINYS